MYICCANNFNNKVNIHKARTYQDNYLLSEMNNIFLIIILSKDFITISFF